MAYQPKSYRKFLTTSVAAAVVATVAVPAVSPVAAAGTNFTDISGVQSWAGEAITYLVEKGAIEGVGGNKFNPSGQLTRGQAAKILALTLELDVDLDAKTDFSDAANHWASPYIAAIQEQTEGVINGYTDGTFKPEGTITRQEMAKMVVEAYGLTGDDNNETSFADNNGWGAEYVSTLASLGIVTGKSAGKFDPNGNVTRAEAVVFVHRTEVPSKRIISRSFTVQDVKALDRIGENFEITFNVPVSSLDFSQIRVADKVTGALRGVEEVKIAADGRTARVTMLENAFIEALRTYTVTVTIPGQPSSTFDFQRDQYIEKAVVTSYDVKNKTIDVSGLVYSTDGEGNTRTTTSQTREVTLKVPADFDYEDALGLKWTFAYDKDRNMNEQIQESTNVIHDAIELITEDGKTKVKVKSTGAKYDVRTDKDGDVNALRDIKGDIDSKFTVYDKKDNADINKYNFAKIVLDSNNKVEFLQAYKLDDVIVVDSVENTTIVGLGEKEEDFKDAKIVKDGSTISIDDLEEGDFVLYKFVDSKNIFAEVYSNTVEGKIESIYEDRITVDGKDYKFVGKHYIDEDNKFANLGRATDEHSEAYKVFEELQKQGDVTLYLDREGNLQYISGDLENLVTSSSYSFVTKVTAPYNNRGTEYIGIDIVTADGKQESYDFKTADLGKSDKIKGATDADLLKLRKGTTPDAKTEPTVIQIKKNSSGEVKEIQLVDTHADFKTLTITGDDKLELDKNFFRGAKLLSNTVLFGTKTYNDSNKAKDVKVEFLKDSKAEELRSGTAYVYKGEVVAIVSTDAGQADTEKYNVIALSNAVKVAGKDIWKLDLYIPGKGKTTVYTEEGVTDAADIKKYDLVNINLYKNSLDVEKIISRNAGQNVTGKVDKRNTSSKTIELVDNSTEFTLAPDAVVLNKDLEEINLSNVKYGKDGDNVTLMTIEPGSKFVQVVLVGVTVGGSTNEELVEAVEEKIDLIPAVVTLADKVKVEAARAAYNALTSAQKDLVSSTYLQKLVAAEKTIADLEDEDGEDEVTIGEVTATAVQPNPVLKAMGIIEKYTVEGTIATGDADEVQLVFTDGPDDDVTETVVVTDGEFSGELAGTKGFFESVIVKVIVDGEVVAEKTVTLE